MGDILKDLNPASLANAIKSNLYAFIHYFRNSSVATVQMRGQDFYWQTPVLHPWFNGVLSAQSPGEDVAEVISDAITYFQSKKVGSFTWWLAPELKPSTWSKHLLPYGFQYSDETPGMAITLTSLPPQKQHSLLIRMVKNRPMLFEWTKTFVQGYGLPETLKSSYLELVESMGINLPLRYYLGYLDGKPVSTSAVFFGAGVAGIYNAATINEARGQGIGSIMTLAPLYEAREMGYRAGVLQSSEMGYSVYQKLGFEKLCQMDHFYWEAKKSSV